ncbi:carboxypeptidase-like regulatory domain-containing protein [Pseudonocardia parietis]|uniref:Alpha-amylase n=1 Tax=Pseudonocardia parietis TaxID=570936 RepID=A0ABS4W4S9_9PSEU|nr:carboxypeptidase-like regulatory domain-containing protein [Pseudonocardia parietis]MBP2371220.1 hypothetical protein [Pseudonocardia parietis]
MSTWALLGLLVVVLVAVGIAAFLRWGRSRDEHPTSHDGDAPPRTVADLVDRRARGLEDRPPRSGGEDDPVDGGDSAAAGPEPADSVDATGEPESPETPPPAPSEPDAEGTEDADHPVAGPVADLPAEGSVADGPADGPADGSADRPADGSAADGSAAETEFDDTDDEDTPAVGTRSAIGSTHSSAPDITRVPEHDDETEGPTDRIPQAGPGEPRVTPDVSIGPVGPPWSRGFKDGKPVEPVEPVEPPTVPTRRVPSPSPVARPRPAGISDSETASRGPDSSAPDISTPVAASVVAPFPYRLHAAGTSAGGSSAVDDARLSTEDVGDPDPAPARSGDAPAGSISGTDAGDTSAPGTEPDDAGPVWSDARPVPDGPAHEVEVDRITADRAPGGSAEATEPIEFGSGAETTETTETTETADDAGSSGGTAGGMVAGAAATVAAAAAAGAVVRGAKGSDDDVPRSARDVNEEPTTSGADAATADADTVAAEADTVAAEASAAETGPGTLTASADSATAGRDVAGEVTTADEAAASEVPAAYSGPSDPVDRIGVVGTSADRAVDEDLAVKDLAEKDSAEKDSADEGPADEDSTDEDPAEKDSTEKDSTDEGSVEAAAVPRPAVAARPDSRSPVDPDLVKRVTAVPAERPARGVATPDTEREFREARDRITAQHGWTGRGPEQQGPADPVTTGARPATMGLVPGGMRSRGAGENPEPPPRPAPRLLRSTPTARLHTAPGAGESTVDVPAPPKAPATAEADTPTETPATGQADTPTETPATGEADTPTVNLATGETEISTETPETGDTDTSTVSSAENTTVRPAAPPAPTPPTEPEATPAVSTTPTPTATPTATVTPTATAMTTPTVNTTPTVVPSPPVTEPAEEVALTMPRSGPEPAAVVEGTAPQDVEVQVVEADGNPLTGAAVSVRDRAGGPVGSAVTGADGVARIPVPGSGAFVVVAGMDGYRPGVAACTVGDAGAGTRLRLGRAADVHGTVRTAGGSPAADVDVALEQDGEPVAESRTGADGTFHLPDLDAGRYRLVAGPGTGVDVEVPAGGSVDQDLEQGGEQDLKQGEQGAEQDVAGP